MIHEALLNLWRNSSVLDDTQKNASIMELQEFLHPGERKLFERILDIALDYHRINEFVQKVLGPHPAHLPEGGDSYPSGVYVTAFCNGVQSVLMDYWHETANLETMFLRNPQLSLTFILSMLEKYRYTFQVLLQLVEKVESRQLYGCSIKSRLHEYSNCGIDSIVSIANRIVLCINRVFYQHLCNWIIYGDLYDQHQEFFIVDEHCPDEMFCYADQTFDSITSTSTSTVTFDPFRKGQTRRPPIVQKFSINWQLVPNFISKSLAETILFMGRIVWIVRNEPKQYKTVQNQRKDQFKIRFKRDLWDGQELEFYRKIGALENQYFNTVLFQSTIEECRKTLTKSLWSIMVDDGNLIEHLHLIRDYYGLGKGELFQEFLTVAHDQLALQLVGDGLLMPSTQSLDRLNHQLNTIFHDVARKIYCDNDKSDVRFQLTVVPTDNGTVECDENTASKKLVLLQLNFDIQWPLHILFHPQTIQLYNKLFNYLLRFKMTQINLQKLWKIHMLGKQNIDRKVWTLRQQLTFLVNNLQYYLQVDVIEAQFSTLLKSVNNANEFEDIIKVHHEFVTNLLAKMFLLSADDVNSRKTLHLRQLVPQTSFEMTHNESFTTAHSEQYQQNQVYNVIIRLLELCDHFCLVASTWNEQLTEPNLIQIEEFHKRTKTVIESLLYIFNGLHDKTNGQHLLQVLYQLDFNRFFSRNTIDFNLSATV